jgi:hypothetical protein
MIFAIDSLRVIQAAMRAILALAFVLAASPACAADKWYGAPPPEYDYVEYKGELSIIRPHTLAEFKQFCTQFGATFACARMIKGQNWCQIVIVDDWLLPAVSLALRGRAEA